jgi:hypothetical protein
MEKIAVNKWNFWDYRYISKEITRFADDAAIFRFC